MDIELLKEGVVEDVFVYRDNKVTVGFMPDAITGDDAKLTVYEYLAKGIKYWDLTKGGEPLEITAENLEKIVPDGLVDAMFKRLTEIKNSGVGKLSKSAR